MKNNKAKAQIEKVRHSLAHLLAMAILEKFPNVKLGIGPTIENGFYYDFDFVEADQRGFNLKNRSGLTRITDADLPAIEKRIKELIRLDLKFKKEIITFSEAKKLFKNQPYKLELIDELKKSKKPISIYKTIKQFNNKTIQQFTDLCAGLHIKSTKEINPDAFKLTKIAGAYWKGSEKNPMLARIYGVAFETKKELENYLDWQKEIEKRDHRILGEKLELFMIDEKIGKGLPLWLPKGYFIRHLLEEYIYNVEKENGYFHVLTPHLAKEDLYRTSGHLAHYKEDMYAPIDIEGEKYYLKPMNCPHHHSIFSRKTRSYKDLPLRLAEFGTVYRFERSGVLSGLIRVRGFTQNDAHIYAAPETLESEISGILKMHNEVYKDFNISNYWYRLSLPDFKNKEKYGDIKNKKMWEQGAGALKSALKKLNLKFVEAIGEATFYGPKIDIQIKNIHGKEDTIATIQVDYYSANKFNLFYVDKDGKEKSPIIIHRAIFGSFDRFFAFLLEQTAGQLPLWLAPVQAVVLNIGLAHLDYAKNLIEKFKQEKIRTELSSDDSVGKRIREAELQKIPYIIVVGDKEIQNNSVNVRHYKEGQIGEMKLGELLERIKKEIEDRK